MASILSVPWDESMCSDTPQLIKGYMVKSDAWDILVSVSCSEGLRERRSALNRQLKAGIPQTCLTALHHPVLLFSKLTAELLWTLCTESFLPEMLSARDSGIIITSLCTFALQDPQGYSDQLNDPAKKWQSLPLKLYDEDPWCLNDESR
ncbi:hypothetical protein CONPUDRAFT_168021 [Coniophora puteana RWD-64-598 SS2]|uniref:Uncharacterized protein n=1 Tax=Coniophora puteana (strain RWD-64-598) TaxID=741705 RepID=A0A5M3MFZ6_CONPW|nr:uncharacterized protein CONPUDRAFT_168021 [Coniophora puteana RWD-64-598 SS2]EIW78083.1 hypothetical protein CONPUDRAFT_168021 [Coniophora puteana RWD-64-598 SS2]